MKKLIAVIAVFGFVFSILLVSTASAKTMVIQEKPVAAEASPVPLPRPITPTPFPDPKPVPYPLCRVIEVKPQDPLRLKGTGTLKAEGRGQARMLVERGYVLFGGRGVVALNSSDNDRIRESFKHELQIGDWTLYFGKGKIQVIGDDFRINSYGKFEIAGKGTGGIEFTGKWKVKVCRFLRVIDIEPIPDVIPENLKRQFSESVR